jgi:ketosteroid isomerase-like protein
MLTQSDLDDFATRFLAAWTTQNVDTVLACYTEDVVFRDPNTHGDILGVDQLRRYITKLFAGWIMTWSVREAHLFATGDGAALLWHATFTRVCESAVVEADGMDILVFKNSLVRRNEVYFDRTVLPLGVPPAP